MRVDQRNAGASISVTGDGFANRGFPVDRFTIQKSSSCTLTGIQTSDVPTGQGFSYAIRVGVSSADASIGAGDNAHIGHRLEGYNVADLDYGLSSAKTITVSFWVKSSIAGTYGFGLSNYADNRSIPREYTINSPSTWEYKTITIAGDTTGTWEKTNSGGLNMIWSYGAGTDYQGTNNTWGTGVKFSTSSQTQLISTLNATFFLTGVQLEVGPVASPFERRPYNQELALCQRYYQKYDYLNFRSADPGSSQTYMACSLVFSSNMRIAPNVTYRSPNNNTSGNLEEWGGTDRAVTSSTVSTTGLQYAVLTSGITSNKILQSNCTFSAEL